MTTLDLIVPVMALLTGVDVCRWKRQLTAEYEQRRRELEQDRSEETPCDLVPVKPIEITHPLRRRTDQAA